MSQVLFVSLFLLFKILPFFSVFVLFFLSCVSSLLIDGVETPSLLLISLSIKKIRICSKSLPTLLKDLATELEEALEKFEQGQNDHNVLAASDANRVGES